ALAAGSHSIKASYGGDANDNGSTSAILTQTVNPAAKTNTTTGLTSNANPSSLGQTVTFTATVSPSAATGTVTFLDGATAIGSGTMSGGVAAFATASLALGSHSITATYGGDNNYNSSTSNAVSQTVVDTKPPSVSITTPANNAIVSGTINITGTA